MVNKPCLMGWIINMTFLSSVFADTQLTTNYSSSKQSAPQTATILFKEDMLALQDASGVTNGFYDSNRDIVFAIDHSNKSYYEIDRAFASQMSEQLNSAMTMLNQQMENAMAGMSEEQKLKFKEMMPTAITNTSKPVKAKGSIIKTGKTSKIAGIDCELAEIQKEKKTTDQLCIASTQATGISDRELQSLNKLAKLASQFTQLLNLADKQKINTASIIATLKQMDGIPLAFDSSNGAFGRVVSVDHKRIVKTIFSVPNGFEKKSVMSLIGGISQE